MQVFEELYGAALMDAWQLCWSNLGTDAEIEIVEQEMAASASRIDISRIILNPTIRLNDQQYRGNLETVRPLALPPLRLDALVGVSSPTSTACM